MRGESFARFSPNSQRLYASFSLYVVNLVAFGGPTVKL